LISAKVVGVEVGGSMGEREYQVPVPVVAVGLAGWRGHFFLFDGCEGGWGGMHIGMGLTCRDFLGFVLFLAIWWDAEDKWHDGQ
jgi:hypothetical protein